jgi:serine/threonine protein kinase
VDDFDNARLCDFGRAKVIGHAEYRTTLFAGFLPYMAPELFPEDESNVDQLFSPSSDIYAFGMLAFEVPAYVETRFPSAHHNPQTFTDEVPFDTLGSKSPFWIMTRVHAGDRPSRSSDKQKRISDIMWEIMRNCWAADSKARPTAAMIVQRIG